MAVGVQALIRQIENERDEIVRCFNAAIEALRASGDTHSTIGNHRFAPKVSIRSPRKDERSKAEKRNPSTRNEGLEAQSPGQAGGAAGFSDSGRARTVKDLIREAVLSQTSPFTSSHVKEFVENQYPNLAGKIPSSRFSRELYNLRVTDRLVEIHSKGEKGGAHVYRKKAA